MDLGLFLFSTRTKYKDFCLETGIPYKTLYLILSGKYDMKLSVAHKIVKHTANYVKYEDLLQSKPKIKNESAYANKKTKKEDINER